MLALCRIRNGLTVMVAAFAVLVLAGCGGDDVQFNGKIFDAMGMSDSAKAKVAEPKLAERAPLVVPPSLERLPAPGSAPVPGQALAGINDYDRAKIVSKEEQQRQQDEYCRKHYEPALARGDASADTIEGPLGPCRASIFTAVKKWNGDEE